MSHLADPVGVEDPEALEAAADTLLLTNEKNTLYSRKNGNTTIRTQIACFQEASIRLLRKVIRQSRLLIRC